ncbi:MAG TPA: hypothetical protein VGG84_10355 [Gemmatimonadaceae bacterium]
MTLTDRQLAWDWFKAEQRHERAQRRGLAAGGAATITGRAARRNTQGPKPLRSRRQRLTRRPRTGGWP